MQLEVCSLTSAKKKRDIRANGWFSEIHQQTLRDLESIQVLQYDVPGVRFTQVVSMADSNYFGLYIEDKRVTKQFHLRPTKMWQKEITAGRVLEDAVWPRTSIKF